MTDFTMLTNLDEYEHIEFSEDEDEITIGIDLDNPPTGVGQGPEHEWVNDYGPDVTSIIQNQVIDYSTKLFDGEFGLIADSLNSWMGVDDPEDEQEIENIVYEMKSGEEDVPYEYQYWLHTPSEFPDDAPSAPPQPGDVDPVTGDLVQ